MGAEHRWASLLVESGLLKSQFYDQETSRYFELAYLVSLWVCFLWSTWKEAGSDNAEDSPESLGAQGGSYDL